MANTSIVAATSAWTTMPVGAVSVEVVDDGPHGVATVVPPMALTATADADRQRADTVSEPRLRPNVTPIVRAQIVGSPPAACGMTADDLDRRPAERGPPGDAGLDDVVDLVAGTGAGAGEVAASKLLAAAGHRLHGRPYRPA